MGTSSQLLDWCAKQIGTVGGSKYWNDVYGWSGNGLPWCAVFVSDALKQTGTTAVRFPNTVAFDANNKAQIGSAWVDKYNLKPGDIGAFDWDGDGIGDHVGFIEKVLGYGVYQTIEGNVSNSCGRRTRYASSICGGIRPKYTGSSSTEEEELYSFSNVKKGSSNNTVKIAQAALNVRNSAGLLVDGYFGTLTDTAVRNFQKKKGITADGIVGPVTWGKLLGK